MATSSRITRRRARRLRLALRLLLVGAFAVVAFAATRTSA